MNWLIREKMFIYFYNKLRPVNRMYYKKYGVNSSLHNSGCCIRSVAPWITVLSSSSSSSSSFGTTTLCGFLPSHPSLSKFFCPLLFPSSFITFSFFTSSITSSCHHFLGLPTGLIPIGFQSSSFLAGLAWSILWICPSHLIPCALMNLIITAPSITFHCFITTHNIHKEGDILQIYFCVIFRETRHHAQAQVTFGGLCPFFGREKNTDSKAVGLTSLAAAFSSSSSKQSSNIAS